MCSDVNKLISEWKEKSVRELLRCLFFSPQIYIVTNRICYKPTSIKSLWLPCTKQVQTLGHLEVRYADIGTLISNGRFSTDNTNTVASHQSSSKVNLSQSVYCYLSSSVYLLFLNSSHPAPVSGDGSLPILNTYRAHSWPTLTPYTCARLMTLSRYTLVLLLTNMLRNNQPIKPLVADLVSMKYSHFE